jgi:TRAP-type C4-dicarboxylate transport system substrate-binding protein
MTTLKLLFRAAICSAALALTTPMAGAVTLNWITYKPKGAGDPQAITTQWFADELARRTNGEDTIRIHWGGTLAGINEIPNALRDGVGEIGDVVTPYFPDQLPVNNAISFFIPQPNSPVELGLLMNYWHQTIPAFGKELEQYNLKLIGLRPLESYGIICTKPIRSMEDFKGKRIRAYGFALPALIEAIGAVPVSMGTPEAYEALERGILDCSPVGPTLAHGWRYDEVAKYYIDVPLGASWGHLIAMNLDSFNSLDSDLQETMLSIGREYLVRYTTEMLKAEQAVYDAWEESGVEIIHFPANAFIETVMEAKGVQAVRQDWANRVKDKDVPVDRITRRLSFN